MVRARGARICDRCVALAQDAIATAGPGRRSLRIRPAPAPIPDREAAEPAVALAFETAFDPDLPEADRCAAIERGGDLAESMREVADRYPPARDMDVSVDHVRFLSEDEAEVHFAVLLPPPGPPALARTGHAVRVGDRWTVSRETWSDLVAMVGVTCPPPEGSIGQDGEP